MFLDTFLQTHPAAVVLAEFVKRIFDMPHAVTTNEHAQAVSR